MTTNNQKYLTETIHLLTETIHLESFDVKTGISLTLSELNNEFELCIFEGETQQSRNMKLSHENLSRLSHLLVPYFSDDFNE